MKNSNVPQGQIDADRLTEVIFSGRFDKLTVAQAKKLIQSSKDLTQVPITKRFYFGCRTGSSGHYLWDEQMNSTRYGYESAGARILPWEKVDGALTPRSGKQGAALLHHKDGWTAIAFADRSQDTRPGSNSAFFFDSILSFDEALEDAKKHFPQIFERFNFPVIQIEA